MNYRISRTSDGTVKYPIHKHSGCEVMLYTEGEGYMRTPGENIPFAPGTIIIVPPGVAHGSVSEKPFRNISVEGNWEELLHCESVRALSDNTAREGETLARLIYDNRYGNGAYLSSLCAAYACFLIQQFEIEGAISGSVKAVMEKISENALDSEIDLAEILRESGYSEDYIRQCFKRITGKTPIEFLTDIRIGRACAMIDIYKDKLSLGEIAERCGYSDYVYFSKRFKSVMGVPPTAYRNQ